MISELHQLSEKIRLLAELTQTLRLENAQLRKSTVLLTEQNADLTRRINTAHQRVSLLLNKIPALPEDHGDEHVSDEQREIV
ncbi:MAG: DUF904 domain-containing protein [Glaciimonas sp.]|nr:DUF904 domain-containing protein [Glaciimonas sp.]